MTTPPSQDDVRRAIERQFRTRTLNGHGSRLISDFPDAAADVVMGVVGPVLDDLLAGAITQAELEQALAELAVRTRNGNAYFPELGRNIFEYAKRRRGAS